MTGLGEVLERETSRVAGALRDAQEEAMRRFRAREGRWPEYTWAEVEYPGGWGSVVVTAYCADALPDGVRRALLSGVLNAEEAAGRLPPGESS